MKDSVVMPDGAYSSPTTPCEPQNHSSGSIQGCLISCSFGRDE